MSWIAWAVVACAAHEEEEPADATVSEPSRFRSLEKRVPKAMFDEDVAWMVANPEAAVEPLVAALAVPSTAERAAIALGRIGAPAAVPALRLALLHPATAGSGWQSALALAAIASPDAEAALREAAIGPDASVAAEAVHGLALR